MCKSVPRPADHRDVKFVQEDSKWVKVPWKRSDSVAGVFGAFASNVLYGAMQAVPRVETVAMASPGALAAVPTVSNKDPEMS